MATYNLIIKNIVKTYNNIFSDNHKNDDIDGIQKIVFMAFINTNKTTNTKNKFAFFKESLEGFLIKNTREDKFINIFCKIQKTYNILNKVLYNYKYKKAKIVVNTDMCLNELNINDTNVMCIFHNNSKYLFHINDLIKIINVSLSHSYMFFSDPKCIKNPYDNLPFHKSTLYNIYFFIKFNTYCYAELFFKFFRADFNLTLFKNNNECFLREYSIQNYVYMSPSNILMKEIKYMIERHNESYPNENITIDDDFPVEKLIRIMRPYLLLYFTSQYSYLTQSKVEAAYVLRKKLLVFRNFNPSFGRKKYKIITNYDNNFNRQICGKIIEFDDKHIKFNNIERNNTIFLSDHLEYTERNYIQLIHGTTDDSGESESDADDDYADEDQDDYQMINETEFYESDSDSESIS